MNPIPVHSVSISIVTAPAQPVAGAPFTFQVNIQLQTGQQGALRVSTVEELMAICAVLQIPGGQLFFNPVGQTLIKSV
jgi:hypothetical protein